MKSYEACTSKSQQALDSKPVQDGLLLRLLLDYAGVYAALRKRATG